MTRGDPVAWLVFVFRVFVLPALAVFVVAAAWLAFVFLSWPPL